MIFPKAGIGRLPPKPESPRRKHPNGERLSARAQAQDRVNYFINKYASENRAKARQTKWLTDLLYAVVRDCTMETQAANTKLKQVEQAMSDMQQGFQSQVAELQNRLAASDAQLASTETARAALEAELAETKESLQKAEDIAADASAHRAALEQAAAGMDIANARSRYQLSLRVAQLKEELIRSQRQLRAHRHAAHQHVAQLGAMAQDKENLSSEENGAGNGSRTRGRNGQGKKGLRGESQEEGTLSPPRRRSVSPTCLSHGAPPATSPGASTTRVVPYPGHVGPLLPGGLPATCAPPGRQPIAVTSGKRQARIPACQGKEKETGDPSRGAAVPPAVPVPPSGAGTGEGGAGDGPVPVAQDSVFKPQKGPHVLFSVT